MPANQYANLGELRERLTGYRQEAVARMGGLDLNRLQSIEQGAEPPTIYELEVLGRLYGIDAEILAREPIVLSKGDSIEVLALLNEFRDVSDVMKARIVAAANAARDVVILREKLGEQIPGAGLLSAVRSAPQPGAGAPPWAQGRHYANWLRKELRLGDEPISSVRDFVAEAFPEITVLHADFGQNDLAGLTFADRLRGTTIVLNLRGKNANPCVRRFSLAHELCHLLLDWNKQEPLATLSGFLTEVGLEREQRANGFASRLLCTEETIRKIAKERSEIEAATYLVAEYGLHLDAVRLYLRNAANVELPRRVPYDLIGSGLTSRWARAEEPIGIPDFPLAQVPPERRTIIAVLAAQHYSEGSMLRDRFAALLEVTPVQEVERVLDYFGLDAPISSSEY